MPSTVVSTFTYDAEKKVLRIVFVTGIIYHYKDVPADIYEAMKNAFSKGIYFNRYVKGMYEFKKMK